ncbi:divalent metal cation transporter [Thermoplasmatales archaeon AK]|nr:divalent metal cation transporter [Thermoplasmatales archaeon AK]
MMADMDASSVLGAAETGALYHYELVWFLLALIVPLYFVQEVSGRIGLASGKGLGQLIRENYGRKLALAATLPMATTDVITYVAEYLGIAIGFNIIGMPVLLVLPLIFIVHVLILFRGNYGTAEKFLLGISFILVASFALELAIRGITPSRVFYFSTNSNFLFILAANAGAVVMPFMLFFQTSATAIKYQESPGGGKSRNKSLRAIRIETFSGAVVTELLMVIVEMATSGTSTDGFVSANEIALTLAGISGPYSPYVFSIGIISAGFLALVVISLGSAWGIVEAAGLKHKNAYWVYIFESLPAMIVGIILPAEMLLRAILFLLVIFVFVLIGPGILLGLIGRDNRVMGSLKMGTRSTLLYFSSLAFVVTFGIISLISSL